MGRLSVPPALSSGIKRKRAVISELALIDSGFTERADVSGPGARPDM